MKLRSALLMALKDHIAGFRLTQLQAAKLLGVTQPRFSDLMRGKIDLFGLDTLVNTAAAASLRIELRVRKAASRDPPRATPPAKLFAPRVARDR
jgi:predicted XRE-type DNA-binding protein